MKLFKFRSAKTAEQNGRPVSLSASPASYQSLFDLNPDLVFSLDSEGRLVEANAALTRILGYTADDLNPEFMEQWMPADQFNQVKNYFHHTLNGTPQSFEAVVRHKQGHYVELSMTTIPHSENNQITGIYGIAKDITERRKLEQRYQSLFKNSINATFVLDVQGNVLDVNEAAIRMTGYARHEQMSFTQFFSAEDLEATMKYHEKVLQGESVSIELPLRHKDGHVIDVLCSIAPVVFQDKVVGIIGMGMDRSEEKTAKRLLEERTQRYQSLFEQNMVAISYFDLEGRFLDCNDALQTILGYSKEELVRAGFNHLIRQEDLDKQWHYFHKAAQGEPQSYDLTCIHKDGHAVELRVTKLPIKVDHQIIGVHSIAKDITVRKQAERALIEAEDKYRSLVEKSLVGVYIIQNHTIVYANPYLVKLLGYQEATIGLQVWDVIHPEDRLMVENNIRSIPNEHEGIHHQFRVIKRDGSIIDVELLSNRIMYQGQPAVIGTVLDITKRKQVEELNAYLAYHDSLTDLPNRRMFEKKLEELLTVARACRQKLAVMYLDMDRFKYVNDSLGHKIGDQLLNMISGRLQHCVRQNDFIARMGGDEFTIVLPDIQSTESAVNVARRIIETLNEPFIIEDYELYITTSVGISMYPNDGEDSESLMKFADSALYRAKDLGKNNFQVFTSSMNVQTYKIFILEKDLRKAIQRNELELYYQPKVKALTGEIVGAEALIRWNHPEWGLITPNEFLSLAEETGLITAISAWVKRTVCHQNKQWQEAGLPRIPISVNVSAKRFLYKEMVSTIKNVLHDTGLDPSYLEIEITEDSLLEHEEVVTSILNELKELGVGISLDDFGTGYSSLSYLKRFKQKINTLKIDKSFIQDLYQDSEDNAIIAAIIQLAHQMNMSVVAEGVETEEQLHLLKHLKCELIQGYLFSKPVPAGEFAKLLRKGTLAPAANPANGQQVVMENQRKYFRITLYFPLSATMTVVKIKGKSIELGKSEVLIEDIGLGGIRFISNIKLAVHPDIVLEIETTLLGKAVKMCGAIVWLREQQSGVFQYGLEFYMHENERTAMTRLLNDLAIQLRKSPLVPGCSFITTDKAQHLSAFSAKGNKH